MTPPAEPLEFMIGGSTSPDARSITPTLNWYGFQAGGPGFPNVGCWEVSYWLAGRDELRFVLRVR